MTEEITEVDVIEALQQALEASQQALDGYYTRRELEDLTGWGQNKMYRVLHKLRDEGHLDVKKKDVKNLVGVKQPTWAYKILSNGQSPEGD